MIIYSYGKVFGKCILQGMATVMAITGTVRACFAPNLWTNSEDLSKHMYAVYFKNTSVL